MQIRYTKIRYFVMFTDIIELYNTPSDLNAHTDVSLVDVDNGRSIRRKNLGEGQFLEVTIGHTSSKENPSTLTDRHVVRVDHVKPDPTSGQPIRASAYMILASPRKGFATDQLVGLVQALLCVFAQDATHVGDAGFTKEDAIQHVLAAFGGSAGIDLSPGRTFIEHLLDGQV